MHGWFHEEIKIAGWVLLPILGGIALRRAGVPSRAARGFFNFSFYGCQTLITIAALWIARIHAQAAYLPFLALTGWLGTAVLAWLGSKRLTSEPRRRGAFILSMSMSNNGFTLLGFVALALFGEPGLAQATYAQLLYTPFFLFCCFPIARVFGNRGQSKPLSTLLSENAQDPRVWLPLLAIGAGLGLNFSHVARPLVVTSLTRTLIFVGTAASSCAIGLLFSGFHWRRFWRENTLSVLYRASLYPLLYWLLARVTGLGQLDGEILVLYGLVPSSLLANLLAVFFELDTDLTSSMFLVSTLGFLLLVLPLFALAVAH